MSLEAPPSYAQATGDRPRTRNGIPAQQRRSMEDEARPLPHGWVRQFDATSKHQFFVDTNAKPARSIWHHPYDDEQYLATLPAEERERIEEMRQQPSRADLVSMSSEEDLHAHSQPKDKKTAASTGGEAAAGATAGAARGAAYGGAAASSSSAAAPPPKGIKKFGRSLKDKMTGTTHEQREAERRERDLQEQREYETHQRIRAAMVRAMETGQPQHVGKDRNGKDVYIEPPAYNGYGGPGGYYGGGGYGYNPYRQGPYTQTPNAVYVRPDYPYNRPYGSGYGGGLGVPLLGGFLGGALLGGLLF